MRQKQTIPKVAIHVDDPEHQLSAIILLVLTALFIQLRYQLVHLLQDILDPTNHLFLQLQIRSVQSSHPNSHFPCIVHSDHIPSSPACQYHITESYDKIQVHGLDLRIVDTPVATMPYNIAYINLIPYFQVSRWNFSSCYSMVSDFFFPQPGGVESHIYQVSTVCTRQALTIEQNLPDSFPSRNSSIVDTKSSLSPTPMVIVPVFDI